MYSPISGDARQQEDYPLRSLSQARLTAPDGAGLADVLDRHAASGRSSTVAGVETASTAALASAEWRCQLWPKQPGRLGRVTASTILSTLAEVVLVLTPIIYIGKLLNANTPLLNLLYKVHER
jgi:hypothetical protein